jgi:hypothetical protein
LLPGDHPLGVRGSDPRARYAAVTVPLLEAASCDTEK